jgi:hypothetical protein
MNQPAWENFPLIGIYNDQEPVFTHFLEILILSIKDIKIINSPTFNLNFGNGDKISVLI